ncbi:MAG: hypothetical protein AAF645_24595 [Myxococcota bacterium]
MRKMDKANEGFRRYRLSVSTAGCDEGPEVYYAGATLRLRYDHEGLPWTTVSFDGVLAMRTIPDATVSELQLEAYSAVIEVETSQWMNGLLGKTEPHYRMPLRRHFIIYFDHWGAVEVLAQSFQITVDE